LGSAHWRSGWQYIYAYKADQQGNDTDNGETPAHTIPSLVKRRIDELLAGVNSAFQAVDMARKRQFTVTAPSDRITGSSQLLSLDHRSDERLYEKARHRICAKRANSNRMLGREISAPPFVVRSLVLALGRAAHMRAASAALSKGPIAP
jgi:hypothetical protein